MLKSAGRKKRDGKAEVRTYYERKREFAEEVLDFIDDVPLGTLCEFTLRMTSASWKYFNGTCVAYPIGFNRESVKLEVLASDKGEPIGHDHVWSRGKNPNVVAVSFRNIINMRPFDEKDLVLCLKYPLRTSLLEEMLKG